MDLKTKTSRFPKKAMVFDEMVELAKKIRKKYKLNDKKAPVLNR